MKRADFGRCYKNEPCRDNYRDGAMLFYSGNRSGSAVFGAACPTEESHGPAACEKILRVIGDSYLGRPSLCDEAMSTLSDFANRSVFAFQEPYKPFLADAAVLFVRGGRARVILSGCSAVYCLSNGKGSFCQGGEFPLFGTKICYDVEYPPEFSLSGKRNAFVITAGKGMDELDLEHIENTFTASVNAEEWAKRLSGLCTGERCSLMTVILPERRGFPAIFGARKE